MKITDLRTFTVGIPGADGVLKNNWVFVKVYTDEGVTGLGAVEHGDVELATEAAADTFRLGSDLDNFPFGRGRGGAQSNGEEEAG